MPETHRINFDPVDIEMEVGEDENILDAAFRQGIHLMHGCREGRCSACKVYLLDGDISGQLLDIRVQRRRSEGYAAYLSCVQRLHDPAVELRRGRTIGGVPIQDVRTRVTAVQPVTRDIVSLRLEAVETRHVRVQAGSVRRYPHPGRQAPVVLDGSRGFRAGSSDQEVPGWQFSGLLTMESGR